MRMHLGCGFSRAHWATYIVMLVVGATFASGQTKTNHWSFQPVVRAKPPVVGAGHGVLRNDIDRFIVAELTKRELTLSPEADRRTLIRRVYFDLIGLPPSSEEVDEFTTSRDPLAYEKLMDRLLGSPRYGER